MRRFRHFAARRIRPAACIGALLAAVSGCSPPAGPETPPGLPLPEARADTGCVDGGRFETRLYGALEGIIDWPSGRLVCEGMPRPDGAGARLRFAGPHPSGDGSLVFIVVLPTLVKGGGGDELPTGLTVIEEGQSRFYASADFDNCWTDVFADEGLEGSSRTIEGRISCIAPLVEVNGSANLSIADLEFNGRIDWDAS